MKQLTDYPQVGLNANWCSLAYAINDDVYIVDSEDENYSALQYDDDGELVYSENYHDVIRVQINESEGTRELSILFTGSIAECLEFVQ